LRQLPAAFVVVARFTASGAEAFLNGEGAGFQLSLE
jgi:hypothetical protein